MLIDNYPNMSSTMWSDVVFQAEFWEGRWVKLKFLNVWVLVFTYVSMPKEMSVFEAIRLPSVSPLTVM